MRAMIAAMIWLPLAAQADTMGREDGMVINPLSGPDFEVIEDVGFGAAEFWCGAATYVQRRRGMPGSTPIYLKSARGPARTVQGTDGVVFSTSDAGLPPPDRTRLSVTVDAPGEMMKAVIARRYCRDAFTKSTK